MNNAIKIVIKKFDDIDYFSKEGLALIEMKSKYGYIDTTGNYVIEPLYDYISIAYPSKHYYKKFRW